MNISIPEIQSVFSIGGWEITNTMIWTWFILIILSALFIWLGSGLKVRPEGKKQIVAEMLYGAFDNMVAENMGSKAKGFVPYFTALFTFIIVSNLASVWGLGIVRQPTADVATTLALALLTFFLTQANKIRITGIGAYFRSFVEPIPIMLPMNIISEVANPVSLTFRLFGNMTGGLMIGSLVYAMLIGNNAIPVWIAVASVALAVILLSNRYKLIKKLDGFKKKLVILLAVICAAPLLAIVFVHGYFDVFAGCLQAYIFCMLSMMFISVDED